ncbi:MAG: hypothetical protein KDJ47_19155 [Hyphomicrobiaceae bacterium]|nr:hypothetical protein [Hyphomicrobiaceae bacterium]
MLEHRGKMGAAIHACEYLRISLDGRAEFANQTCAMSEKKYQKQNVQRSNDVLQRKRPRVYVLQIGQYTRPIPQLSNLAGNWHSMEVDLSLASQWKKCLDAAR